MDEKPENQRQTVLGNPSAKFVLLTAQSSHTAVEYSGVSISELSNTLIDQMDVEFSDCSNMSVQGENQSKETSGREKKATIQEELNRMLRLPATSAYVIHRKRVLNKIMHLMSIQRSASEDEELELLFAQMSL